MKRVNLFLALVTVFLLIGCSDYDLSSPVSTLSVGVDGSSRRKLDLNQSVRFLRSTYDYGNIQVQGSILYLLTQSNGTDNQPSKGTGPNTADIEIYVVMKYSTAEVGSGLWIVSDRSCESCGTLAEGSVVEKCYAIPGAPDSAHLVVQLVYTGNVLSIRPVVICPVFSPI
ncbi:MAG: hypothetical protein V1799_21080 [bacterium]